MEDFEAAEILEERDTPYGKEFLVRWKKPETAENQWVQLSDLPNYQVLMQRYRATHPTKPPSSSKPKNYTCSNLGVEFVRKDEKEDLIFALISPDGHREICNFATMRKLHPQLLISFFEKEMLRGLPVYTE